MGKMSYDAQADGLFELPAELDRVTRSEPAQATERASG